MSKIYPLSLIAECPYNGDLCIEKGDRVFVLEQDEKGWARGKVFINTNEHNFDDLQMNDYTIDVSEAKWFPFDVVFPSMSEIYTIETSLGTQFRTLALPKPSSDRRKRFGRIYTTTDLDFIYQFIESSMKELLSNQSASDFVSSFPQNNFVPPLLCRKRINKLEQQEQIRSGNALQKSVHSSQMETEHSQTTPEGNGMRPERDKSEIIDSVECTSTESEEKTIEESSSVEGTPKDENKTLSLLKTGESFAKSCYSPELRNAIEIFNEKPSEGLKRLRLLKAFEDTPEGIAHFLFNTFALAKDRIGEFLGDENSSEILEHFLKHCDFMSVGFDAALRRLLSCFKLSGEAQKIDRIMQKFAVQYFHADSKCESGERLFCDSSAIYVLAFASIMLNTDLHNKNVKRKMTLAQFMSNVRGINGGDSLDKEFLTHLYQSILDDEIKLVNSPFPMSVFRGWLFEMNQKKYYWFILDVKDLFGFEEPGSSAIRRKYPLKELFVECEKERRIIKLSIQNEREDRKSEKESQKHTKAKAIESKLHRKTTQNMKLCVSDRYMYTKWLKYLTLALHSNGAKEIVEDETSKDKKERRKRENTNKKKNEKDPSIVSIVKDVSDPTNEEKKLCNSVK